MLIISQKDFNIVYNPTYKHKNILNFNLFNRSIHTYIKYKVLKHKIGSAEHKLIMFHVCQTNKTKYIVLKSSKYNIYTILIFHTIL